MTVAKMSVYKRMKLACCFDCGRSEQDCSCMSGSVHSNMDTLQRAYPLSSVSIHDCATTLRACKLHRPTHAVKCLLCVSCTMLGARYVFVRLQCCVRGVTCYFMVRVTVAYVGRYLCFWLKNMLLFLFYLKQISL